MLRALLWGTLLFAPVARATEDAPRILSPEFDQGLPASSALPPAERYLRAEAVLKNFGAPPEAPNPGALAGWSEWQNAAGAAAILPVLDPQKQFSRFFTVDQRGLAAFLDRDQKATPDYQVDLAATEPRASGLLARLREAAQRNPPGQPLAGLRIAIDPGHMGSDLWDERTGKLVKAKDGTKLSEGLINLQTALLLEKEFTSLGATVSLTRRGLTPVSAVPYETFSVDEYARRELRAESLSPWFEDLLQRAAPGPALYRAFSGSAAFRHLFNDVNRINYFTTRLDLEARWLSIEAAAPDITLIVHYDASSPSNTVQPRPIDGTKVYVVGAFTNTEFATQASRVRLAKHLLDPEGWSASLSLGRAIVNHLHNGLGVRFDLSGGGASTQVEPGVFARNLGVSAALSGQAVSYIECLHYDDPNEFRLMKQATHPLLIGGVNYPYSDRLAQVVSAIRQGVLEFVASYATP